MSEMNVSHEEKWCLLRSTGKNGQKVPSVVAGSKAQAEYSPANETYLRQAA
jgi:hypothetical protein